MEGWRAEPHREFSKWRQNVFQPHIEILSPLTPELDGNQSGKFMDGPSCFNLHAVASCDCNVTSKWGNYNKAPREIIARKVTAISLLQRTL